MTSSPLLVNLGLIGVKEKHTYQRKINMQMEEEPLIKVIFQNEEIASRYRKKIRDFFRNSLSITLPNESSNCTDLVLEVKKTDIHLSSNAEFSRIDDTPLFTIDSTPTHHDIFDIPIYGKKFDRVLTETNDNLSQTADEKVSRLNCFNCLGNHNLRDCTTPKNHFAINKNRKEFISKIGSKNSRYHSDRNFKPGVISSELKKALGLLNDELPNHIYKMRLLGYPPGWLEEAKLENSGLNLYNSDGHPETGPNDKFDETCCPSLLTEYDLQKIYDFPGYNVSPPMSTRNEYWHADQQAIHSKTAMLQILKHRNAGENHKKRNLKQTSSIRPVPIDIECSNDKHDKLSTTNSQLFSNPRSSGEVTVSLSRDEQTLISTYTPSKVHDNEVPSSLIKLETKKKYLLQELKDCYILPSLNLLTTTKSFNVEKSSNDTLLDTSIFESCNDTIKVGSITSVELGTPLIENVSIYNKLPSSEKFSKDVCDIINFENLPGATGKFEKMNDIIQKIRSTLIKKKINKF